ncbi:MAG: hypothetical protein ACXWVQ_07045 [Methyloceanibacter sp.]
MLRKFLVASTAVAAISTLLFVSQAEAGSCAVLSEKAIGLKKSETYARALKQLNRKAKHWAKKNGYKTVSLSKVATKCSGKGALNHCTVAAKVCGH